MNIEELQKWYNSFTFGNVTYKDGKNFTSRLKNNIPKKKIKSFKISFGKYKGKTLQWIKENDNSYLLWLHRETKDQQLILEIEKLL